MSLSGTAFPSLARTSSPAPVNIDTCHCKGIIVDIDVSVVPGSAPSVVFNIYAVDPVPATPVTTLILASAAITAVGHTRLKVYLGLTAAANLVASDILPGLIQIAPVHTGGNSVTYSVSYCLVP